MTVDDRTRTALLVEAHSLIKSASDTAVRALEAPTTLMYPPGEVGLSHDEEVAVHSLSLSPAAKSALRKIIANASAEVLFGLFCVADGVGDPPGWQGGIWLGVDLTLPQGDRPMLHDDFLETYWKFVGR